MNEGSGPRAWDGGVCEGNEVVNDLVKLQNQVWDATDLRGQARLNTTTQKWAEAVKDSSKIAKVKKAMQTYVEKHTGTASTTVHPYTVLCPSATIANCVAGGEVEGPCNDRRDSWGVQREDEEEVPYQEDPDQSTMRLCNRQSQRQGPKRQ